MKKAIINFFRAIFRRNIVVKPGDEKSFQLLHVDEKASSLTDALGISPERADELGNACEKAFVNSHDTVEAINKVGELCVHINEFFFCSTVINKMQMRTMSPLGGMLGMILGGGQKGD